LFVFKTAFLYNDLGGMDLQVQISPAFRGREICKGGSL
jgi:hypothetical protein